MNRIISCTFFFLIMLASWSTAQVRLNEVCSKNDGNLTVNGETPDWIELYNEGTDAVQLLGYQLSDDLDVPAKWTFPSVSLEAGDYLVVLADGTDTQDDYVHTNFKLSSGENIVFSDADGQEIEELDVATLESDTTYAYIDNQWRRAEPTPGSSNAGSGLAQLAVPDFTLETGVYADQQSLIISTTASNGRIEYYINDLGDLLKTDNPTLSLNISQSTMICARADADDKEQSALVCKSFVIGEHSLPVVSILADEFDIFDPTEGLFSLGPDAEPDWPFLGANFWSERSEEVYFQYFNDADKGVFIGHADLEMHGGRQARTHPQKTFKLLAKSKYDQAYFNFPFSDAKSNIDSYKRLVIRNASGDYNVGHCRDGFLQDHFAKSGLDIDGVAYEPIAVYINGKYYGMMGLREKIDEYYTESNYGTSNIDLLEEERTVVEGTSDVFDEHFAYVRDTDLTDDEAYQQAATYFDVNSLIDYFIAQVAMSNSDWPLNNIKYWRERGTDHKWRYFLFDLDAALGRFGWTEADEDILADKLAIDIENSVFITIMKSFLINESFRYALLNRHQDLLNTVLSTESLQASFADFEAKVDGEMMQHLAQWPTLTYDDWKTVQLQRIKDYMADRPTFSMQHFETNFLLDGIYNLSLTSNQSDASFELNSLRDVALGFEGRYFFDIPIRIKSVQVSGLQFVHWEITTNGSTTTVTDTDLQIAFDSDAEVRAIYNPVSTQEFVVEMSQKRGQLEFTLALSSFDPIYYTIVDTDGKILVSGMQPVDQLTSKLTVPYTNSAEGLKVVTLRQGKLSYVSKIAMLR